jgi:hypothetical protein
MLYSPVCAKGTVAAVGAAKTVVVNYNHVDHFTGLSPKACPGRKSEGSRRAPAAGETASSGGRRSASKRNTSLRSVSHPVLMLGAGANGAGKSTVTSGNPETFSAIPLLDPDTFMKPLRSRGSATPFAAGRQVLRLSKTYLESSESFCVETTLSGKSYLKMISASRHSLSAGGTVV